MRVDFVRKMRVTLPVALARLVCKRDTSPSPSSQGHVSEGQLLLRLTILCADATQINGQEPEGNCQGDPGNSFLCGVHRQQDLS